MFYDCGREGSIDGSIVEFVGKEPGNNGIMSDYHVEELIVYPK